MKKTLIALGGLFLSLGVIYYECNPIAVEVHELSTNAYAATASEASKTRKELSFKTITFKSYSEEDLELLAHAINAEQGIEYEDARKTNMLQLYAGEVLLNRVNQHYRGCSTIEEVLYSPGQYACVSDCSWDNPVSERAYRNAKLLLLGVPYWEIYDIPKLPDNVIYQAEFEQGSGTWKKIEDTYFCYE